MIVTAPSAVKGDSANKSLTGRRTRWYSFPLLMARRSRFAQGVTGRSSWLVVLLYLLLVCDLTAHAVAPASEHSPTPSHGMTISRSALPSGADSPSGTAHYGSCACQHGHVPVLSATVETVLPPPALALAEWSSFTRSIRFLPADRVIRSPPFGTLRLRCASQA